MKKTIYLILMLCMAFVVFQSDTCNEPSADQIDKVRQEKLQEQGQAQVGMPDIHNFTEKKMVKMLYELRDKPDLVNYAYLWSDMKGTYIYFGQCVGFGIPYSTQYSNPEKWVNNTQEYSHLLPQSEPNGLFMPTSTEGTWLMMINPHNPQDIKPVYVEPRVIVSPFKL